MSIELSRVNLSKENADLVEFLKQNFNETQSKASFDWQFKETLVEAILMHTRDEGEIICTQSFLPHNLCINQDKVLTAKSEHTFLSKKYRGSTIFYDAYNTGLDECKKENIWIVWGFTSGLKFMRKLKFKTFDYSIYDSFTYFKMPPLKDAFSNGKAFLRYGLNTSRFLYSKLKKLNLKSAINKKASHNKYQIVEKLEDTQLITTFFNKISGSDRTVRLDMDDHYLDWRVYKNPNLGYKTFFFLRDSALAGFYFYCKSPSLPSIELAEFVFDSQEDGNYILYHLINEIEKEKDVYFMHYFGNKTNPINQKTFSLLEKYAYTRIDKSVMGFVLKNDSDISLSMEDFYINTLWTQGFTR